MHKKLLLLTSCTFLLILAACHKTNSSTTSQGLVGNWTFLYMTVQSKTTEDSLGVSSVSIANYTTRNNSGTVKFTSDSMVVSGLAYSVDTTFMTYFYIAGALYDSVNSPLSA